MKRAAIECTVTIALVGALASPVVPSTHTPVQAQRKIELAQYCMPPADLPDTHRFYCLLGGTDHGRP
jgi:hypothetical protein